MVKLLLIIVGVEMYLLEDHLLLPATVDLLDELFSGIGAVQELYVAEGVFFEGVLALHHCVTPGEMLHQ